ncbi:MAG: squalene/phytoene synthase family protein [Candidatus Eremiobacteraeota bacterium]|nr:squalene/phytoene synthase family protein [Candidatus Eremiobacteraeota bacterium]
MDFSASETFSAAPDVRAAYQTCRELTRIASKTFYLASLFLAAEKRRAVWAVYAFCRTADDVVDRTSPSADRIAALDDLERKLLATARGRANEPIFIAYADAARRFDIPLEPALALLRGARMDITIRRYATYDELCEYCYLVASTVGLLVTPILGTTSAEASPFGVTLGRAMQLTNILRDVGEDALMGRIYLPAEDLERFGYAERRVFEQVVDENFVALMQFQIERVRALYAEAEPGIALLSADSRYTVRLALSLYRGILSAIELNGYNVFSRRAYVPLRSKIATALGVALAR